MDRFIYYQDAQGNKTRVSEQEAQRYEAQHPDSYVRVTLEGRNMGIPVAKKAAFLSEFGDKAAFTQYAEEQNAADNKTLETPQAQPSPAVGVAYASPMGGNANARNYYTNLVSENGGIAGAQKVLSEEQDAKAEKESAGKAKYDMLKDSWQAAADEYSKQANEYSLLARERRRENPVHYFNGAPLGHPDELGEQYRMAAMNNKAAARVLTANSRYGETSGMEDFWQGVGHTLSSEEFWTLSDEDAMMRVRGIIKRMDEGKELGKGEQALLDSYFNLMAAQAIRSEDLSRAYQSGQIATESIPFMAEFALTNGIAAGAKAATKATVKKGMTKALQKVMKKEVAEKVAGGAARFAGHEAANVARFSLSPSNLSAIANDMVSVNDDGTLTYSDGGALLHGGTENFVELASESSGEAMEQAASWLMRHTLGSKPAAMFDHIRRSGLGKVVRTAGFNGLVGEMAEEWYGSGVRSLLGVMTGNTVGNKDELKEFATIDQQLTMLGGFAPMTAVGMAGNVGGMARARRLYDTSVKGMQSIMEKYNLTEGDVELARTLLDEGKGAEAIHELAKNLKQGIQEGSLTVEDAVALYQDITNIAMADARLRVDEEAIQQLSTASTQAGSVYARYMGTAYAAPKAAMDNLYDTEHAYTKARDAAVAAGFKAEEIDAADAMLLAQQAARLSQDGNAEAAAALQSLAEAKASKQGYEEALANARDNVIDNQRTIMRGWVRQNGTIRPVQVRGRGVMYLTDENVTFDESGVPVEDGYDNRLVEVTDNKGNRDFISYEALRQGIQRAVTGEQMGQLITKAITDEFDRRIGQARTTMSATAKRSELSGLKDRSVFFNKDGQTVSGTVRGFDENGNVIISGKKGALGDFTITMSASELYDNLMHDEQGNVLFSDEQEQEAENAEPQDAPQDNTQQPQQTAQQPTPTPTQPQGAPQEEPLSVGETVRYNDGDATIVDIMENTATIEYRGEDGGTRSIDVPLADLERPTPEQQHPQQQQPTTAEAEPQAETPATATQETPAEDTALARVPKDDKGEPLYEQADTNSAWDALLEQTEGDVAMAQAVAEDMVRDKQAALKKSEKATSKGGTTVAEKIASEKARRAAIEQARAELEAWQKIAAVNAERERVAEQAETEQAAEQARQAEEQAEEQARLQAEAEERAKMQAEAQAEQTQAEEQEKPAQAEERAEVQAESKQQPQTIDEQIADWKSRIERLEEAKNQPNAATAAIDGLLNAARERLAELEIALAEQETEQNPTEGQKEAGNYKKGHIKLDGYDITIENPKGSVRRGIDQNGNAWETEMHNTYGYIRRTESVDGDHIDVFLSDNPTEGNVYVIDQINPETGEFDEHKVMYGFNSEEEAKQAYLSNYSKGWMGLGNITAVSKEEFKKWVDSSHRKTKPFVEYANVKPLGSEERRQSRIFAEHKAIISDYKEALNAKDKERIKELEAKYRDLCKEAIEVQPGIQNIKDMGVRLCTAYNGQMSSKRGSANAKLNGILVDVIKEWFAANGYDVLEMKGQEVKTGDTILSHAATKKELFILRPRNNAQIAHLEEIKNNPGADKKLVQAEIDRLKAEQQEQATPKEYVYRLNLRPFGIGNQPEGGRHINDGSSYGAVVYDRPLSAEEVKNFSLRPITEAKDLAGKKFEAPFGKGKIVYTITDVDDDGVISFTMNTGKGETEPQMATYYQLLNQHFRGKAKEVVESDVEQSRNASDSQGNPTNDDGTLKVDVINSIDELTDADFTEPTRNVQLPKLPQVVDDAIGAAGKPVVIKKNIFEKNRDSHKDLSPEQSREILTDALYTPDLYGQNQKTSRPYNWILIHNADKHSSIVLEVNHNKDNVEIVNWHYLDDDSLEQKKNQAIKEGGRILTLASAAGNTLNGLSSEGKDTNNSENSNNQNVKSSEKKRETAKSEHKIEDYGEQIAGARKDMLRDIAKTLDNATIQSLVELPFSKVFKRPDLRKMVENGTLREKDARFADAVIFAFLSGKKPVANTKQEQRLARYGRETNVESWAKYSYQGIEILKSLFNADESERDALIEKTIGFKHYGVEAAQKEQKDRERWNPGKTYDGTCYPINPVLLFHDAMERLGYPAGQKVVMPVVEVRPDTRYASYTLIDKTNHRIGDATSYDSVVDNVVYLAKVANADEDTEHPRKAFRVKGENQQWKVAEYRVRAAESWNKLQRDRYELNKTYPTKEEAQKAADEYKAKGCIVLGPDEVKQLIGYEKYGIYYVNPLTSTLMKLDKEYETEEEARAAIDAERETLNAKANEKIAEEANKAGTKREDSWFKIVYYWDAIADGKKSGKGDWRYSIQLDDKYTTTKSALNTMPVVMAEGFKTREEAQKELDKHKEEWKKYVQGIIDARRNHIYFGDENESRKGEDYRGGRDVTEDEFGDTFGFRGVQFGNWADQKDRQAALNNAYDSFMDLAKVIGVSPKAISLNGELGIAFGARGTGSANAHYEPVEVVINLTKTRGAGSLAHEWWHALDNYFSRSAEVPMGFATESKTIKLREEMREAFNQLIDDVNNSDYHARSKDRGASYWGTTIEETARLFAEWVGREMAKNGERNPFLVRGAIPGDDYAKMNYNLYTWAVAVRNKDKKSEEMEKAMTFEEFKKTPMAFKDYVYPTTAELETIGEDVRNIFDVVEERKDENTGNVALFNILSEALGIATPEQQLAFDTVTEMLQTAGIPVEMVSDETLRQLAEDKDAQLMTKKSAKATWIDNVVISLSYIKGADKKKIKADLLRRMAERRRQAKEIYANVLSGNFNEVTLRQINDYIDNATNRNIFYRPLSQRLPEGALASVSRGGRAGEVDALFSRICESTVPANERTRAEGRRRIEAKKEECLEGWARATGNWHESIADFTNRTDPIDHGKDSDVYVSNDGRTVIKASKGKFENKKYPSDIDQVALFNAVFPHSAYRILGYGRINGKFLKFLEQGLVDFSASTPLTTEERVEYMHRIGFEPRNEDKTVFSNGEILVSDLQKANIVRDASGNVRVIDADVKLHTRDIGGNFVYPLAEEDTKDTKASAFLRNGDVVYGAAVGGRILLNEEQLNPNTPLHEYTHLWDKACRAKNPELWRRGVELMKQTALWEEVKNDPNYQGLDEDGIASEVHSRLTGKQGAARLEALGGEILSGEGSLGEKSAKMSVIARLKAWLSEFWYWLRDTFTPWSKGEAQRVTIDDFANMPLADLAKGVRLGESLREQRAEGVQPLTEEETALRDTLADVMRENGLDVITDEKEGQRVLDWANEGVRLHAKLNGLIKAANFIAQSLKGKNQGETFTIELPTATINKIRRVFGNDFESHNISANSMVHAKKNHGVDGKKIDANSIPLRDEDFELAPYIMTAPDRVERGSMDAMGRESIRFEKTLSNGVVIVVEKEQKNSPNDMETITMWAESSSSNVADARSGRTSPAIDVRGVTISSDDAAKIRKDAEDAIRNEEKIRKQVVKKGDLTDKELNALIEHIEESLKSIPEKSTDELYGIIRQISEMNHNATKGYGRLTDYEWQNNTRIYTLKSEGLNAIVPELLSRGEHIGYNAGDGIVYFRDGQGRQISFHGYTPERAIENELDKNVEWDGKTEAWRNDDDLEVKRQRATMRQQIQEEISSLQEQKYKLESESKAKIKAARIERFGQQWRVDDNTARLTYVNNLGERAYPIDYSNSKNARKSDLQKAAELCPEMEEPISAYIEKDKALNDHWSTIWRLDEEKRKAQNSLQRSRKPESIENAQKTFAEIEETLNTLYKEIGNKKQEKQKAWENVENSYHAIVERIKSDNNELMRPYEQELKEQIAPIDERLDALHNELEHLPRYSTLDGVRFFRTKDGEAYGFTVGGKIYFDPKIATSETPIHEYTHLWATALQKGNPAEWENVVGLMKGTSIWDEVKARYPELKTDSEIADEVLAHYSGRRGAERLREEQRRITESEGTVTSKAAALDAIGRVKRALQRFWKAVADFLHIHYTTAEEVADRVMKDLLNGVDPRAFGVDSRLREQFVGEKGAAAADRADVISGAGEAAVRLDNLAVAREMEAAKKDAKAIKMATGWERGADGKWRYEIPDIEYVEKGDAVLERTIARQPWSKEYDALWERVFAGETLPEADMKRLNELSSKAQEITDVYNSRDEKVLADYVRNDELFKSYPELKRVKVVFVDERDFDGKYSEKENTIYIKKYSALPHDEILAHEIQHAIQHIEGFARGGNLAEAARIIETMKTPNMEDMENFVNAVELYDKNRDTLREDYTLDKYIGDLVKDGEFSKYFAGVPRNTSEAGLRIIYSNAKENIEMGNRLTPLSMYRSLSGEVESRNVQKRLNMTPEERRASLAAETEDVAREDQIFLFGEDGEDLMGSEMRNSAPPARSVAQDIYNNEVEDTWNKFQQEFQDARQAARIAINAILEETGGGRIAESEDYLTKENLLTSVTAAHTQGFTRDYYEPLNKTAYDVISALLAARGIRNSRKNRAAMYEILMKYIIAKHGLERDAYYNNLHAGEEDYTEHEWSGISDLFDMEWEDATAEAEAFVQQIEDEVDTAALWSAINAATTEILKHDRACGLISAADYATITGMFDYYVPLRGFAEETAEEVYSDSYGEHNRFGTLRQVKTGGRTSLADNPIATIMQLAQRRIAQGLRNVVKQSFYRFVQNRPNSLVTEVNAWYAYNSAGDLELVTPPSTAGVTARAASAALAKFKADMEQRAAKGEAFKGDKLPSTPYRMVNKSTAAQHVISVLVNGRERVLVVNGNPKLAQIVNGISIKSKWSMAWLRNLTRKLSPLFTNYSVFFLPKNMMRDCIYAQISADTRDHFESWGLSKEQNREQNARFAAAFRAAYLKNMTPGLMVSLLTAYRNGTLRSGDALHYQFAEFIANGGQTGYTQIDTIERHRRALERRMRSVARGGKGSVNVIRSLASYIELLNEGAELMSRFAAYRAGRSCGMTIQQAITEAKEVSVNFNTRGEQSGSGLIGGLASLLGAGKMFFNASVQGLQNFAHLFKNSPKGMSARTLMWMGLGFIQPIVNTMLASLFGDDDDETYWNISEYTRRSNMVIGWKGLFMTLALPPEVRAFYGIGDVLASHYWGKDTKDTESVIADIASRLMSLIPASPLENVSHYDDPLTAMGMYFIPDIAQPVVQMAMNKNFMGLPIYKDASWNENKPYYTRVYAGAPRYLTAISEKAFLATSDWNYPVDINPEAWDHYLEAYGGGIYKLLKSAAYTVEDAIKGDLSINNTPVVSSIVKESKENAFVDKTYWDFKELMDSQYQRFKAKEPDATPKTMYGDAVPAEWANRYRVFQDPRYDALRLFYNGNMAIEKKERTLKEWREKKEQGRNIPQEKIDALEAEILMMRRELVDKVLETY